MTRTNWPVHSSLVAFRRVAGDEEADPADHAVLEIGAAALNHVVDGKQQLVPDALAHRVLELLVVERRPGVGAVPVERHVAGVAVHDPVVIDLAARATLRTIEIQQPERTGPGLLEVERRRDVEARTRRAVEQRMRPVDGDGSGILGTVERPRARSRVRVHVDRVDPEDLGEHSRGLTRDFDLDRVVRQASGREIDRAGTAAVRGQVLRCKSTCGTGALRQLLSAGKDSCVRGRLRRALGAVPRADVEDEGDRAEQRGHEDDAEDGGLAGLAAKTIHSTRSVVSDSRLPDATTMPRMLIS